MQMICALSDRKSKIMQDFYPTFFGVLWLCLRHQDIQIFDSVDIILLYCLLYSTQRVAEEGTIFYTCPSVCQSISPVFSSTKLKAQVSFSEQNLFVVRRRRHCWRCRKLFTFSSSSSEPLNQFQPISISISTQLGTKHLWVMGIQD